MLQRLINSFIPAVNPERFTQEVEKVLKNIPGEIKTRIVNPLHIQATIPSQDSPMDLHLDNIYLKYLENRRRRKEIIAHYAMAMTEMDTELMVPRNIIPVIKDKGYVREVGEQLKSKGSHPGDFFVVEEYNEELVIVYAVDSPTSIRYLNPKDLPELNLHGATLRSFAIDNLKQVLPAVEVHGKGPFFSLQAGGMFESSLLLMDRVWNKKELGIEGEIVVAVPSRETMLVADSTSSAAMDRIRKEAKKVAESAAYRLTDKLFVRREERFLLWND